jgi:hypothetical protein
MSFPHEHFADPGYDASGDLDVVHERIETAQAAVPSYTIPFTMLPPVGAQGTSSAPGIPPSCTAWAGVYGLATAAAARVGQYNPSTATLQASPASIYIQVIGVSAPPCKGSSFQSYFKILAASGTPNFETAQYYDTCSELISVYHDPSQPPANDPRFKLPLPTAMSTSDQTSIEQALLQNRPIAYGTRLYSDFYAYKGTPTPYVGNGHVIISGKTGNPAGHSMMIIGYNNTMPYTDRNGQQKQGAYLIQNSFGPLWGDNGYIWMAFETFLALAQVTCFAY